MCLAGTRAALGGVMHPASLAFPALSRSLDYRNLHTLHSLTEDTDVVATGGALLQKLLEEAAWSAGKRELTTSWLLPDLFAGFTDHLRKNAVALLVSATDSRQQHRSSRILLRHSAHTVQTHEFTPRGFSRA
jgi:hypothetical protein